MKTEFERVKIYTEALNKWGAKSQIEMAMEESIELALAIRKYLRNTTADTCFDMAGEIADIEIMIEQLKLVIPDLQDHIDDIKEAKLIRLEERLKTTNYEL